MRSVRPHSLPGILSVAFTAAVVLAAVASLTAQEVSESDPMFAPPDRQLLRMLDSSRELLDQGRYLDAIQQLTTVLEAESDFFVATAQPGDLAAGRRYQSFKNEARKILSGMPPAAQEVYESRFGPIAQRLLNDALTARDFEQISEVQRRYFHTTAGHEARYLLGSHFLIQGQFGRAANCFQKLRDSLQAIRFEPSLSLKLAYCWLRAGEPARAEQVLLDLQQRAPKSRLSVGGREVELFQRPHEALDWLRRITGQPRGEIGSRSGDWAMFRHDPARQGRGSGGLTQLAQPVWRQAVPQSVEIELTLQAQRSEFSRASNLALPSVMPLAIDNIIVMRTPQRLAAVDFQTGKRIWQVDEPDQPSSPAATPQTAESRQSAVATLTQRMWLDKAYGSLSSDGNAVFVLEGFGVLPEPNDRRATLAQRIRSGMITANSYTVLSAYDLRNRKGNRIWSVSAFSDDAGPSDRPLFLGPPLPLEGELYSLVEIRDEIRLVVLDPGTGELLWSQRLALVEPRRFDPLLRQTSGISPSFADGILICPTGAGAVVAVDLTTRSLLWACTYPPVLPAREVSFASDTWADSCAVISDRRVLITPAESLQMHCLNLADGSHQWSLDRGDLAFLACVDRGLAIAVGRRELTGIELATGRIAAGWPLRLPEGSLPSGRGYYADGHYYLPLNVSGEGQVAAVQLAPPMIVHHTRWPGDTIPGNLICHRGQIVSQNVDWLESFHQAEPLGWDAGLGRR